MIKFAYTIFYVKDAEANLRFYETAFEFTRKFISPDAQYGELITGETTLSFAAVAAHPDGFSADIITDKSVTFGLGYGVDITECGICKLFEKHHYKQYRNILCDVDYITTPIN